jgi:hypothetical protein
MGITHTAIIIHTATIGRTRITATTGGRHSIGTGGIDIITATIVTTTITDVKVT